ncbi:MAG: PhoX family phosphatase [Aquabacterium sp.]|nr:PhoX family phosphatase [Aquabacterium sp.]
MSSVFHPSNDETINPSGNASIRDVMAVFTGRRNFMKGTLGAATVATLGGFASSANAAYPVAPAPTGAIGFTGLPPNLAATFVDAVSVPPGYTARTLIGWGDAIGVPGPAALVSHDHSSAQPITAAVQNTTFGQHNDGMHFFPFPAIGAAGVSSDRGLLVVNHEYVDPGLHANTATYADPLFTITKALVDAQVAAHGVSVVELRRQGGQWGVVRPSAFARRITGATPMTISGPAAGADAMKTAADPTGTAVLGTLNNCAHGITPWGTYLTCEENWNGYFGAVGSFTQTPAERRYGLSAGGFGYRWHEADARFNLNAPGNRNEPNRFGWVVEIDPFNPNAKPIKRTALGRIKHESADFALAPDGTVCFYTGDDERNDYMYKFVCAGKFNRSNRARNRNLLDSGTLYVARFNADGSGTWLPLVFGQGPLTADNGFTSQADVLIRTRQAADRLGATMMDRPEWVAVHPTTREVYLTLTNNNRRGTTTPSSNLANGSTAAGGARPPVDAANPRRDNRYGHIIRWTETNSDPAATTFAWDIFVECGDKQNPAPNLKGNINGDDLGAPDGLWFDKQGRLWIQTDQQGDGLGDWSNIGGNAMFACDPSTRKITRFATSPRNCETTGVVGTPDYKTMFMGIQHPGEDWAPEFQSGGFTAKSTWPDSGANGTTTQAVVSKPRSAVVVITKNDGGVIGS